MTRVQKAQLGEGLPTSGWSGMGLRKGPARNVWQLAHPGGQLGGLGSNSGEATAHPAPRARHAYRKCSGAPPGAHEARVRPWEVGGAEASYSGPPAPGERSRARGSDTFHSLPSPRAARRRGELSAKWRAVVSGHAAPGCAPYLFQVALAQARRCCVPRSSAPAAPGSLLPRSLRLGELMNFNLRRVLMLNPVHARPASPTTIVGR